MIFSKSRIDNAGKGILRCKNAQELAGKKATTQDVAKFIAENSQKAYEEIHKELELIDKIIKESSSKKRMLPEGLSGKLTALFNKVERIYGVCFDIHRAGVSADVPRATQLAGEILEEKVEGKSLFDSIKEDMESIHKSLKAEQDFLEDIDRIVRKAA